MEFKNLAEVELLGEVPEGASVLAATAEGEVVRVPGDGLGGSGGGGIFTVTFTSEDSENYTADKTLSEIEAAYSGGGLVRGVVALVAPFGTVYTEAPVAIVATGDSARFNAVTYSENALSVLKLYVYADGVDSEVLNYNLA